MCAGFIDFCRLKPSARRQRLGEALVNPLKNGGPSRTRTLDPLIKRPMYGFLDPTQFDVTHQILER
jgi:hypothetical protein